MLRKLTFLSTDQFLPDLTTVEDKEIAPSLAGFEFSKSSFAFLTTPFLNAAADDDGDDDDDDDDSGAPMFDMGGDNFGDSGGPVEDFFSGPDAINDGYGGGDMGGDDYVGNSDSVAPGAAEDGGGAPGGPFVPFDPRKIPNERDLVMAMADADENGALDYFDKNFMKNWAGPEHWKLRRVIRKRESTFFFVLFYSSLSIFI